MNAPWRVMFRRRICGGRALMAVLLGCQLALLAHVHAAPVHTQDKGTSPATRLLLKPQLASPAQWQLLPGVGPVLAGRLAAALHGDEPVSLEAVDAVPGVGPQRLARWRPLLHTSDRL